MVKPIEGVQPMPPVKQLCEFEVVARLESRLAELRCRKEESQRRAAELERRISGASAVLSERVRALLDPDKGLPTDLLAEHDVEGWKQTAELLRREVAVLDRALADGEQRLPGVKLSCHPEGLEPARAWWRQLAVAQARAVMQVVRLRELERDALRAVEAAGYDPQHLQAAAPTASLVSASYDEPQGHVAQFVRGLVEAGVLTGREDWLAGSGASQACDRRREAEAAAILARREAAERRHAQAREAERRAAEDAASRRAAAEQAELDRLAAAYRDVR